MKRRSEQKGEKEEKYRPSLATKIIIAVTFATSIIFMQIPLASGFMFSFLALSTVFDILTQEKQKRGEKGKWD